MSDFIFFNFQAYWRAAQAAKMLQNGIPRALDHIMAGLRQLEERNMDDMISFLTELCILIPSAPAVSKSQLCTQIFVFSYLVSVSCNFLHRSLYYHT